MMIAFLQWARVLFLVACGGLVLLFLWIGYRSRKVEGSDPMQTATMLRAAADTHAGLQRDVNQDRVHVDLARGLFLVIDGVGGHAAGGKAADIALRIVRARLERETGSAVDRVREAIAI